jgi:hypothetical protein
MASGRGHGPAEHRPCPARLLRSTDFGARVGGEEFVVICPRPPKSRPGFWPSVCGGPSPDWVRIRGPGVPGDHLHRRGHAQAGRAQQAQDLLRQADQALYHAKSSGRNMVCKSAVASTTRRPRPRRPDAGSGPPKASRAGAGFLASLAPCAWWPHGAPSLRAGCPPELAISLRSSRPFPFLDFPAASSM